MSRARLSPCAPTCRAVLSSVLLAHEGTRCGGGDLSYIKIAMCFAHTQMVMLLLPPTAQMDCQSSHWKPFQERSYPKSIGKELSAPIHQKYCRNKTAIYIAWQMRHSNKAETLKSPFCLTQIKSCLSLCSLWGAAGHHEVSPQSFPLWVQHEVHQILWKRNLIIAVPMSIVFYHNQFTNSNVYRTCTLKETIKGENKWLFVTSRTSWPWK